MDRNGGARGGGGATLLKPRLGALGLLLLLAVTACALERLAQHLDEDSNQYLTAQAAEVAA